MATAFWGLQILPNKTYSQVIEGSFRVSMASFGEEVKGKQRSCLSVVVDGQSYVLCSLTPNKVEQQPLDIIFTEGEEITFSATGENTIHLTGNYLPEDDEELDFDEEDLEDIDEFESEEEDEVITDRIQELESEEEEEEEEEEDEEEKPVPAKKRKQPNGTATEEAPKKKAKEEKIAAAAAKIKEAKQAKEAESTKPKAEEKKADKKTKQEEKKAKQEEKKPAKAESKTKTLPGGLIIEDKVVGNGVAAKKGNKIGMRYIGRLTNGKIFDQNTSGKPFWFRLGAGEVISGWDKGIVGMKVGGERLLTIPAPLAYGKRGAPPDIPGNATLIFEVKLVQIK